MMEQGTVVVEQTYAAPIDKVWEAISSKDQMKQWYFDLAEFRLEVGFRFQFSGKGHKGAHYMHLCTITEIIPLKKLQYSWEYEGHPGYSLVTFELFDLGDQTKVRLTHSGLESFPQDNPDFAQTSFNGGWNALMGSSLARYLGIGV